MLNPNNFIANSDYPFDMVAKVMTGNIIAPSRVSQTIPGEIVLTHGLNFLPLVAGYWSLTEDFQSPLPFGAQDSDGKGIGYIGANDSNILLAQFYNDVGTKYYYRVYCMVPNSLDTKVPTPPLGGFQNFIFNSDLAYLKIYQEGDTTASYNSPATIEHNLGFVPYVRFWEGYRANPSKSDYLVLGDGAISMLEITDRNIIFSTNPMVASSNSVHYRIYADET